MQEMAATPEMAELAELAEPTLEMLLVEKMPETAEIASTASEVETFTPVVAKHKVEMVELAEVVPVALAEAMVACATAQPVHK